MYRLIWIKVIIFMSSMLRSVVLDSYGSSLVVLVEVNVNGKTLISSFMVIGTVDISTFIYVSSIRGAMNLT